MRIVEGKVTIITGAAKGIGASTADLFAQNGAKVVIADMNEELGNETAERIKEAGGVAHFIYADVTKEADVVELIENTVALYGRLDAAVNNAALLADDRMILEMDPETMDRMFAVNLKGVALCMKHEIRQMLKQSSGGTIVNISSMHGIRPQPISPVYVTTKASVIGLSKSAALDYAEQNIRVNALAPGSIITPLLQRCIEHFGFDEREYARQLSMLGRFAKPTEIAEGAMWLCSDDASFVTGITLAVDGGYTAM